MESMISIDPPDTETEPLPVINLSKWTGSFRSGIQGPLGWDSTVGTIENTSIIFLTDHFQIDSFE